MATTKKKKATAPRKAAPRKAARKAAPRNGVGKLPGIAALARQVLAESDRQKKAATANRGKRRKRRNPADDIGAPPKKIRDLLGEFLGHEIENVEFAEAPAWCPNDGVLGGQCVALEYFAFKPHLDPDGPKIYRHEFEPGACQVVFTSDRVIILLGGYTIGPDGIEG